MSEQKKILVIDDEPDMGDLVKLILQRDGYIIKFTADPNMFFRFAEREVFDLFILDLMMPVMDGWDIYQKLRADENTKDIPVIICTSKAQTIDKVLGLHIAKVDDYITKPFSPDQLRNSVKKVLSKGL